MARDRFGRDAGHDRRRRAGIVVVILGFFFVGWISFVALASGGGESAGKKPPAAEEPKQAAETSAPQAPPPPEPLVEAEPVSLGDGGDKEPERTTPPEGAAEEPAGHDPLDTGAKPGDLTETEKGRIELAASNFVVYAYGYTGDDEAEYNKNINRILFPWSFYESPGGQYLKDYRQRINDGGTKSEARLDDLELVETSPKKTTAKAKFSVQDDTGERRLSQKLTLEPFGAAWRVSEAEEIQDRK